jgi:hypothetical protein
MQEQGPPAAAAPAQAAPAGISKLQNSHCLLVSIVFWLLDINYFTQMF